MSTLFAGSRVYPFYKDIEHILYRVLNNFWGRYKRIFLCLFICVSEVVSRLPIRDLTSGPTTEPTEHPLSRTFPD